MIYLDNHNLTAPCQSSIDQMQSFLSSDWASPVSPHRIGQDVLSKLEPYYERIYDFLGAKSEDTFIFTSSGAEAINQVILSTFFEQTCKQGKNHYVTTNIEDAPILLSLKRLEEQHCTVKLLGVDKQGRIDLVEFEKAINPKTALVTLSWSSSLLGSMQDLAAIAKICKKKQVLLHVDVSSAVGKLGFSFQDFPISYLTIDGALIHSVKSSGGILIKEGSSLSPMIVGGIDQMNLRAGHLDVPSLVAFSTACKQAGLYADQMGMEVARLKGLLESKLSQEVEGVRVLLKSQVRLPNVSVISFTGIQSEALLFHLNEQNIFASAGGGSSQHISRVLSACGFDSMTCATTVSFVLSRYTTEEEILKVVQVLKEICPKLQAISEEVCP